MSELFEILRYPDPRLRRKCEPVKRFDPSVREIAEKMLKTMYSANGIGLAAAQVGVLKRIVVIDLTREPGDARIFVNPEITARSGSCRVEEGCLSVPGLYAQVNRAETVSVRYHTPEGKQRSFQCSDLLAICIQHEIDHLDGRLFVDYLSMFRRIQARLLARKHSMREQTPARL